VYWVLQAPSSKLWVTMMLSDNGQGPCATDDTKGMDLPEENMLQGQMPARQAMRNKIAGHASQ